MYLQGCKLILFSGGGGNWTGHDGTGTVHIITSLNMREICMIFRVFMTSWLWTWTQSPPSAERRGMYKLSATWGEYGGGEWWCTNKTMTQQLEAE